MFLDENLHEKVAFNEQTDCIELRRQVEQKLAEIDIMYSSVLSVDKCCQV